MANEVLERTLFETSRLLDFFSVRELQLQTGLQSSYWPVVILKELVDNGLDACESAGVPPEIQVVVEDSPLRISVSDNGPGMGLDTIKKLLDFGTRLSDKEAYVSPTRGAQGNALKTLLAIPFVLSRRQPQEGTVTFESGGVCYRVTVKADLIAQCPVVTLAQGPSEVKTGTRVGVSLPDYTGIPAEDLEGHFLQTIGGFAFLNPHASFSIRVGTAEQTWGATAPPWRKWLPTDPTSAHWYTAERLKRLVTAYIARGLPGRSSVPVEGMTPRAVALNRAILDPSLASPGWERKYREMQRELLGDIRELEKRGIAVVAGPGGLLAWEVWLYPAAADPPKLPVVGCVTPEAPSKTGHVKGNTSPDGDCPRPGPPSRGVTPEQVLDLHRRGYGLKRIAAELGISHMTARRRLAEGLQGRLRLGGVEAEG